MNFPLTYKYKCLLVLYFSFYHKSSVQTVISFHAENICRLNTLYCFVAVNTRHPSVWLVVDLQSISESSLYSLQQREYFLMSSLWMKGGLQARAIFWHCARDKHCLLQSEQRDAGPLNCFSPTGSSQANCDYTLSLHHLWNICALLG